MPKTRTKPKILVFYYNTALNFYQDGKLKVGYFIPVGSSYSFTDSVEEFRIKTYYN